MLKRLLPLTLALTVLVGATSSFATPDIKSSIVRLNYITAKHKVATCTGIVISAVKVLTAKHCIGDEGEQMFVDAAPAIVSKSNDDLAVLETLPMLGKVPITFAKENAPVAAVVRAYGHAYSGPVMELWRHVAGYVEGQLFLDGPVAKGMSGGPVVNEDGELVGINQASNEVVGIMCPIEEIREFLDR